MTGDADQRDQAESKSLIEKNTTRSTTTNSGYKVDEASSSGLRDITDMAIFACVAPIPFYVLFWIGFFMMDPDAPQSGQAIGSTLLYGSVAMIFLIIIGMNIAIYTRDRRWVIPCFWPRLMRLGKEHRPQQAQAHGPGQGWGVLLHDSGDGGKVHEMKGVVNRPVSVDDEEDRSQQCEDGMPSDLDFIVRFLKRLIPGMIGGAIVAAVFVSDWSSLRPFLLLELGCAVFGIIMITVFLRCGRYGVPSWVLGPNDAGDGRIGRDKGRPEKKMTIPRTDSEPNNDSGPGGFQNTSIEEDHTLYASIGRRVVY